MSDVSDDDYEPSMFFDYDGQPAYRDDKGFMVIRRGGAEEPVSDMERWLDSASPISEEEFLELKAKVNKG